MAQYIHEEFEDKAMEGVAITAINIFRLANWIGDNLITLLAISGLLVATLIGVTIVTIA